MRDWDHYFLSIALTVSRGSKDPATQVGAVLVDAQRSIIATGYNGFPRGINDSPSRLSDREVKLGLMVHAEMNAVLAAASRGGGALRGSALYLCATDSGGIVWGGPPCSRCAVELIQAGVRKIVAPPQKSPTKWEMDLTLARALLKEAGVELREVEFLP